MTESLRLGIAQINCTVGDFEGNYKKIIGNLEKAESLGVDIVSFPELAITGYPPEDLLLKKSFIDENLAVFKKAVKSVGDITAIIGFVDRAKNEIYNAAGIVYKGTIQGVYRKIFLPNYSVFDERRYFKPGSDPIIFRLGKFIFGINICEDIWHDNGPLEEQAEEGADLIIDINASPYHAGKIGQRESLIRKKAKENKVFISYTNLVGGQDELVFDGQSMVVNNKGEVMDRASAFTEDFLVTDISIPHRKKTKAKKAVLIANKLNPGTRPHLIKREVETLEPVVEIYQALILGLKDYVNKNGFKKVVIGLSGGVDSSLVAAVASDSLGRDNITGVFMPTRYSSSQSESDAKELASNLGIKFIAISIEEIFKIYLASLESQFSGLRPDTTEENIQARIRGNILMALSNKFGWLVLTTGNKSEISTGYATLYGDMAGGFAVIKDVPKELVYELSKYRNSLGRVIPESVLAKEPTAELRPGQKDQDTLPPYETLDPILKAYVEEDRNLNEIISLGFDKETVSRVTGLVDKSEYKRRQAPPGIKITPKAFGKDRRMPITNKYR